MAALSRNHPPNPPGSSKLPCVLDLRQVSRLQKLYSGVRRVGNHTVFGWRDGCFDSSKEKVLESEGRKESVEAKTRTAPLMSLLDSFLATSFALASSVSDIPRDFRAGRAILI